MNKVFYILILLTAFYASYALAKNYEVPPSETTSLYVPYISDEAMEKCVILYNETKWLGEEIQSTHVDKYNHTAVDAYNQKLSRYENMINTFNRDCAEKQSESAYKAALELSKKQ